jgi:hypothetical protein
MKKISADRSRKFWTVFAIAFSLPIIFAILDVIGFQMWDSIGGFTSTAYSIAEPLYMKQFWTFAYIMIAVISLTYFILTKDKSESIAILLIPCILLQMGVEDVIFYIIQGIPILYEPMPWLTGNLLFPTWFAHILGSDVIIGWMLCITAVIGIVFSIRIGGYLLKHVD